MTDTNTNPTLAGTPLAVDEGVQEAPASAPASHVAETDANAQAYTPVFGSRVRTVVYLLGLVASVVGLGFMSFGRADIGGFISTAAGFLAAGFGVVYNPLRMGNK